MSPSTFFALLSVSLGFVAGCLFCIGSVLNAPSSILEQATPYNDFNRHVAKSLTRQRAQYLVGSVFLFVSFVLQLGAAVSSGQAASWLPRSWVLVVLASLVMASVIAVTVVRRLIRRMYRSVQRLNKKRMADDAQLRAASVRGSVA
jgi:hypothetical protein